MGDDKRKVWPRERGVRRRNEKGNRNELEVGKKGETCKVIG